MKEKNNKGKTPADKAWELFSATGKVSYYMLYKNLKEK